jgi:cytochrome c-type biogenesis protein CcmH/NrfF
VAAARLIVATALAVLALAASAQACTPRTTLGALEDEVMCTVCGLPLSLATESPQAQSERALILRLVDRCQTKAQIERRLVAEYGSEVLASPPSGGFDATAWLIPLLALLALAGGLAGATGIWRARST